MGPADTADTIKAAATIISAKVPVYATVLVTGNKFFCLCGKDGCPATGGIGFDPQETVAAAALTMHGQVALPSRDAFVALVAPDPVAHASIGAAIAELSPTGSRDRAVLKSLMRQAAQGNRLTDDQVADLVVRLRRPSTRIMAWLASDGQMWQRDLWFDVTRRAPDAYVSTPANLAAWCAWRQGTTVLAEAALNRAAHVDPNNVMTQTISRLVQAHASPHDIAWPPPVEDLEAAGII